MKYFGGERSKTDQSCSGQSGYITLYNPVCESDVVRHCHVCRHGVNKSDSLSCFVQRNCSVLAFLLACFVCLYSDVPFCTLGWLLSYVCCQYVELSESR